MKLSPARFLCLFSFVFFNLVSSQIFPQKEAHGMELIHEVSSIRLIEERVVSSLDRLRDPKRVLVVFEVESLLSQKSRRHTAALFNNLNELGYKVTLTEEFGLRSNVGDFSTWLQTLRSFGVQSNLAFDQPWPIADRYFLIPSGYLRLQAFIGGQSAIVRILPREKYDAKALVPYTLYSLEELARIEKVYFVTDSRSKMYSFKRDVNFYQLYPNADFEYIILKSEARQAAELANQSQGASQPNQTRGDFNFFRFWRR